MPRPSDHKPNLPPSYDLHVLPPQIEGTGNYREMDFWSLQGFDLKGVISVLYNINPIRIALPASLDDGRRYDFSLVLPEPEDQERMCERFHQGIEDHFHVSARHEDRSLDVYVVTTRNGKLPAVSAPPGESRSFLKQSHIGFEVPIGARSPGGVAAMPKACSISAICSISVEGTTDEFCQLLERILDRPIVNETNLKGEFEFHVEPSQAEKSNFLDRLRDELGLVIAPAQRNIEILVFDPR
jgi:uncharacterized protein (TIGR03435 family)